MKITINGNVTINTAEGINQAVQAAEAAEAAEAVQAAQETTETQQTENRQPIDRTNEVLIDNSTTFSELVRILQGKPEAIAASLVEAREKEKEAEEKRRRELYGEDYELLYGGDKDHDCSLAKLEHRPKPGFLRNFEPMVAKIEFPSGGYCEVYSNGYAIYDNGNRKAVVWVPDCGSATYYFGPLKDKEKEYLDQKKELSEDDLGPLPWHIALIIGGEDRIEYNMAHPKSKGTASDAGNQEEWESKANYRWICGAHFDSPEEAYFKKEEQEERRKKVKGAVKKLKPTQREAIEMCYFDGLTQAEAAKKIGRSQSSVSERIKSGKKALEKKLKEIF